MIRIDDYEKLKFDIVRWLKDYYWMHNIKAFVVGVSGGIDSAVVSTLCAETDLPTYVVCMPLESTHENTKLSDLHSKKLEEKYDNVTRVQVELSSPYMHYQVAGAKGGIVVGTGNKVEDYGIGFFTKYGDGAVDIAPIADLYKSEVWELGEYLGVSQEIVDATPTDGLWGDRRTDEDQIGATYAELEEAMENGSGPAVKVLEDFKLQNGHKMQPIPTFKL